MADFCALASPHPQLSDSASPGRHQPISLRETVLFEKWSKTLRVCLMADFCAYSPRVAAAGARAFCTGRTNGRKSNTASSGRV